MAVYQDGELVLYGIVGESFWDEGFTASEVLAALAEHGRDNDLTVRLNSGGGIVNDAIAIYNALSTHKGKVTIQVDAIAASAATVIAMAGQEIVMRVGSIMMIHDPMNVTFGNIEDHEKTIEQLTAYANQMASIYAERSGNELDDVRSDMKAEIWLTAEQAVEKGYADKAEAAKAKAVAAFDYRIYAHAPKSLTAMAVKKNWSFEAKEPAASAPVNPSQKGNLMTDKERADQLAAELDALKANKDSAASAAMQAELATLRAEKEARTNTDAIMALDEAKGREAQAKALADVGVKVGAAKAVLSAAPSVDAGTPGTAEYEAARAAGAGLKGNHAPKADVNAGWAKAFARTNAS
ncbi:peptidase S14, ClpP [Nitrobacter hamburgensis X14]|uniref:ATP-dependent Clp protease proteolytic subunit n=1 Tax=Nitrobacter hamburgensis (strain DSM 10229 / NCIMB 13809 / X14) TaxID=323097 RepID=Q1QKR7_NITHX|nr:head maturation protease, ClpP-related [Nitrobacter hamburgensis]ABE63180.1 peptidase S14, ClpP [Nitrobacter hamburgensis X14]